LWYVWHYSSFHDHSDHLQAAERQPFLRRFANDWATKVYMMIYLKNRRNFLRKQERLGLEPEPDHVSEDEDDENENGASRNDDDASVHSSDDDKDDDWVG
jgi:hypothetical protein